MFCENCGNKLADNALFCPECGVKVEKRNIENKPVNTNNNVKSGLKTASIVLGVLGIVGALTLIFSIPGFIMSLIGLILGICSTKKVKNVLGIVLSSVGLCISIVAIFLSIVLFRSMTDFFEMVIDESISSDYQNEVSKNKYDFSSIDLDVLYENKIPIEKVLDKVDKIILDKKYPETDEIEKEIDELLEEYYNTYSQYYGYTKDEILKVLGFNTEKDFTDYLKLNYRRNKYVEDYLRNKITDDEIETYYEESVFGDINSKHILVMVSEDYFSDKDAKKLANEIIKKLNSGSTWEEVINKYKDKIISEELGYKSYDANLEYAYLNECRSLEVGKYSTIPVKTSYGYHIIYKIDQKERPSLEEVKDKIINAIVNRKLQNNEKMYAKLLIDLRKESGFSFGNTSYEYQYEQYIENNS